MKPLTRFYFLAGLALLPLTAVSVFSAQTNDLVIYRDRLANGFEDWSWATRNFANTSTVHSDRVSISVTAKPWEGLFFRHPRPINTADYKSLGFWAHGGEQGGQLLMIRPVLGGQLQSGYVLPQLPPNQWQQLTVPLTVLDMADKTNFQGFQIQLCAGVTDTFYVDDIQLDAKDIPLVIAAVTNATLPVPPIVKAGEASAVAGKITPDRSAGWMWIGGALVVIISLLGCLVLLFWRREARTGLRALPVPLALAQQDGAATDPASAEEWRQRALAAEALAGKQGQIMREKIMPELTEFAKQSLVQGLYVQRSALIETNQKAQSILAELESRLAALQLPLQERIRAYEKRIAELEREMETQGEEVRELVRATLALVRKKLEEEREQERTYRRSN